MKQNLDTLKTEIERYLEESGMAVFYGCSRGHESAPAVYWDCDQYPDYKLFVKAAQTAGAKLIVFHQHSFAFEQVEDALDELEDCGIPQEEYREFKRRLDDVRLYDGFVCSIELSFDCEGRIFLFDLRTEWYEELTDLLDEIHILSADADDDMPMSGYFSKN